MPSRICPDVLNDCNPCAGEFPFANLSAELGEPYVFVSPHIIIRNPPLGRVFSQFGCKRWCYSAISQADADACAIAQATECATVDVPQPPIVVDPPLPPTGFPTVSVFAIEPSTRFGQDPGVFNLSRNGSFAQPLTVQFTLSGEAQNGVDYDTIPYSVTIAAGDSNVDIIVVPMDTGELVAKDVILTVLGGSNYSPGDSPSDNIQIAGSRFWNLEWDNVNLHYGNDPSGTIEYTLTPYSAFAALTQGQIYDIDYPITTNDPPSCVFGAVGHFVYSGPARACHLHLVVSNSSGGSASFTVSVNGDDVISDGHYIDGSYDFDFVIPESVDATIRVAFNVSVGSSNAATSCTGYITLTSD